MSKTLTAVVLGMVPILSMGQADSVIINVGESSKVIFAIGDRKDLETLKQYDFQAVVNDLVTKLQKEDSTKLEKPADTYLKEPGVVAESKKDEDDEDWDESWEQRRYEDRHAYRNESKHSGRRYYGRRTRHSFNFDLGMNNYIADNKIPDIEDYTVKQWGSWYVALNSTERTRLARKFFLEWGGGVSWYNFKFENETITMGMDDNGVTFTPDPRELDFVKSKLTACYLNVNVIPMIDFGGNSRKAMFFDGNHSESFRIGLGPYAGYRIDSYSKLVYKEDGDKHKDRNHENFYLDNLRYGLRLQIGFRDTDLFFNYDLNGLFTEGRGPKLNAFSFGITL